MPCNSYGYVIPASQFHASDCWGDIKPDNILVARNNIDELLAAQIAPGQNSVLPKSPEGAILSSPLNVFTSTELADLDQALNFDVRLTDYGTAAFADGYHADEIQPPALRAPEVILGSGWGTSADVWNLGCLIFELLTGRWLFSPRSGQTWTAEQYHLAHMPGVVGEDFNLSHFRQAKRFQDYFREDEGRLRIRVGGVVSLEGALQKYGVISGSDTDDATLVAFIRSMLRLNPSDRATAAVDSRQPLREQVYCVTLPWMR
ncbi:Serine/threonine-protein kinase spk-1 [Leucoagaricus sp. SymC.cos]|nr:Serine/threonine-protein kinase spk-1 [Leucoagaricus sp. SymC.cos]